jgi:hypothetical protein
MIYLITPEDLTRRTLETEFYPNLENSVFWSASFDPSFYIALAEAGFISISHDYKSRGVLLIAELQESYAVLDWANLHTSGHLSKLLSSPQLRDEAVELRVVEDSSLVLKRIREHHGENSWLRKPYLEMLAQLPCEDTRNFTLHGVELWSTRRKRLIAGELGYTIGRSYTSLSGFHTPDTDENRSWRHFGTLQMWMLAKRLEECGFAFWNMGHPYQKYKSALGAAILPRGEFLERWLPAQADRGGRSLRDPG